MLISQCPRVRMGFAVVVTCGVLLAMCAAQQVRANGVPPATAKRIIANEKAVWEAAKHKDMERFSELVADDAHMVFSSGMVTRAEYIRSIANRNITRYTLANFHLFIPAPGVVIITYKATIEGVFNGRQSGRLTVREASVWINRAGKWLAVLNQETPTNAP